MTQREMIDIVTRVVNAMREGIKREVCEHVNIAIEQHRRAVWVKTEWCCNDIRKFAKEVWDLNDPPTRDQNAFGSTSLMLRGYHVNYCPFCGAKV